jgi:hypothetical protein
VLRAAILILIERPLPDKQEAVAAAFALAQGLNVVARCCKLDDALAMLVLQTVAAVVCALDPGRGARARIEQAGGLLFVARVEPVTRLRREVSQLAVRMYRSGLDTQEISNILEVDPSEVRQSLARGGVQRRPPPN